MGFTCNSKVAFTNLHVRYKCSDSANCDFIQYISYFLNCKNLHSKARVCSHTISSDPNQLPLFLPLEARQQLNSTSLELSAMILGFSWAFAILATVSAAPIDGFPNLGEFTEPLPDSLLENYSSSLRGFTSSSFASPVAYLNDNTTPIIPIDHFGQPSPESNEIPNIGESNLNTDLPMTIPVGFKLDSFSTAQANSGATIECNLKGTQCSYCQTSTSCAVYLVVCNKIDPNDCALCARSDGVSVPVCQPYTAEIKALPPPAVPVFGVCVSQQCNNT